MKMNLSYVVAIVAVLGMPAHSQTTSTFTGGVSDDYGTAGNWSPNGVPDLSAGNTALINNGDAVGYAAGTDVGDLLISNGGELEISNGSWTQTGNNNWIQLGEQGDGASTGDGSILVNGGTFNQGTSGNSPFNITGTGNSFTISSGTANFSNILTAISGIQYNFQGGVTTIAGTSNLEVNGTGGGGPGNVIISSGTVTTNGDFQLLNGLTQFKMTGGVLNVGNEADFSATSNISMTGGTMNIYNLFTMVNGPTGSTFNLGGGLINDEANAFNGWYAPSTSSAFNFTTSSTGTLQFDNDSLSLVAGWVNSGDITYQGAADSSAFDVTQNGSAIDVTLQQTESVPEPSTYALLGAGMLALLIWTRRKARA